MLEEYKIKGKIKELLARIRCWSIGEDNYNGFKEIKFIKCKK